MDNSSATPTTGTGTNVTWGNAKAGHQLSETTLSTALFRRASEAFLQSQSQETLHRITADVGTTYDEFVRNNDPLLVKVYNPSDIGRGSSTVIITAISDRPFIIDTLTESFRQSDIKMKSILHPLLQMEDGQIFSLTYTEVDRIDGDSRLEQLQSQLQAVLEDLRLITDDFDTICTEVGSVTKKLQQAPDFKSNVDQQECTAFLNWILDGGLVFLGHNAWLVDSAAKANTKTTPVGPTLGLFRSTNAETSSALTQIGDEVGGFLSQKKFCHVTKLSLRSKIHRGTLIDVALFAIPTKSATQVEVHCFLGLLTSRALAQEAASIPIVRQKIEHMLKSSQLVPHSHDYKEFVSIINKLPKSKLLRQETAQIQNDLDIIMRMQREREVRLSIYTEPFQRFVSTTVTMPRECFGEDTRIEIQNFLEHELNVPQNSSDHRLTILEDERLILAHFLTPLKKGVEPKLDVRALEKKIADLCLTWEDKLHRLLDESFDVGTASYLKKSYSATLPQQYQAITLPADAAFDITRLELLDESNQLEVALRPLAAGATAKFELTIYKYKVGLTLSDIVPVLENVGFHVIEETSVSLHRSDDETVSLYRFTVSTTSEIHISTQRLNEIIVPTLKRVISGQAENDRLNTLLINPGLREEQIHIVRALHCYLWQIKAVTSEAFSTLAIVDNPDVVQSVVEYFECTFDPNFAVTSQGKRLSVIEEKRQAIAAKLKLVERLAHDRVLRALVNVIDSTVRTNYFQKREFPDIALKIDCAKIDKMPRPRPMFEILVYSKDFEGVHLRGGKVARGGIRWSDRHEDFRTEVLGLMATQMLKNSIIVPVGAKGGFVVKPAAAAIDRQIVQACYSRFISCLLMISDNLDIDKHVKHPEHSVIYDTDDPYLVVAADKGTATYSDLANEIAVSKFNFWLGDAFASGGSCGYDHKKLGITAKGAWECVYRHFRELGIEVDNQEITVVGIGDMSGDVFGNGLLQTETLKLIGAFNHKHIFVDPNPNAKASFAERKRLFELKGSQWSDYDASLISKGGGVFQRTSKAITISPEARTALGISEEVLSGDALITAILRAPVDLLWNGGIGTYVKASSETNLTVDDRVNDDTRISADEVRAKVIGEGGNLGFTQLARIEYALAGGNINTDAIDNSGGVNLSDLEVNLKILLREPLLRGDLTKDGRDELIRSQSLNAVQKILDRNKSLSRAVSLGSRRSRKYLGDYRQLLEEFERRALFHRRTEFLPTNDELDRRAKQKIGLTRPELAIIHGHVRMHVYNVSMSCSIVQEQFLQRLLLSYFPEEISARFKQDVLNHSLYREIIATQIANQLVDTLGASFIYRTAQEMGTPEVEIIAAFITAFEIIGARQLLTELQVLDRAESTGIYLKACMSLGAAIDSMTRWIIQRRGNNVSWNDFFEAYRAPFSQLMKRADSMLPEAEAGYYRETCKQLASHNLPQELAGIVASFPYTAAFLDVVSIAQELAVDVSEVGKVYAVLSSTLQLGWLSQQAGLIEPVDHWEALALRRTMNELGIHIQNMTRNIVSKHHSTEADWLGQYMSRHKDYVDRYLNSIQEFRSKPLTLAALLVISGQVQSLARRA